MCEAIIGLFGAIIGSVLSIVASTIAIKNQRNLEDRRVWYDKQIEIFFDIVELLNKLQEFIGSDSTHKLKLENIRESKDEEGMRLWEECISLEKKLHPKIHVLFGKNYASEFECIFKDVYNDSHDTKFASTSDAVEAFVDKMKHLFFNYDKIGGLK